MGLVGECQLVGGTRYSNRLLPFSVDLHRCLLFLVVACLRLKRPQELKQKTTT